MDAEAAEALPKPLSVEKLWESNYKPIGASENIMVNKSTK